MAKISVAVSLPGLQAQFYHLLAVLPWVSNSTSLNFHSKRGTIRITLGFIIANYFHRSCKRPFLSVLGQFRNIS